MMKIDKRNFIDYTLLLFTIAVSGIPYFMDSALYLPLFIILFPVFLLRKKRLDWMFVLLLTLLVVVTILQTFVFNFYSMQTIIGLLLRVIIAYLIVKILEEKFVPYFINILFWMAIISLAIYFSTLLVPVAGDMLIRIVPIFDILNFADSDSPAIVIYNLVHLESLRNSGPFWEPGAFAGYLIVAYIFNFFRSLKIAEKKNMVLLITIVTTLSTAAYLALFIFFSFVYFHKIKNVIFKLVAIITIGAIGIYVYNTFDFIGKKIEQQLHVAQTKGIERSDNSQRFLNILRDVNSLKGHELIGRGGNNQTRFDLRTGEIFIIPTVGLTDIIVRFGIPFFILILYFLYTSMCVYLKHLQEINQFYCLGMVVTILITLLSETYFSYPMFWSLLFLQFAYRIEEDGRSTLYNFNLKGK